MKRLSYEVAFVVLATVAAVAWTEGNGKWHYRMEDGDDLHGGVPMGIPDDECDNGKAAFIQLGNGTEAGASAQARNWKTTMVLDYLEVDWDNSKEDYECSGSTYINEENPATLHQAQCTMLLDPPTHVCLPQPIAYTDPIPTAGAHRPLWAKFGEYRYLPKQRWLHNLEHGCAVFLYHPCADPQQVKKMRAIANDCLRKHIITPLKELSRETPFAVLTYGCKLLLPYVDADQIIEFLRAHALDAPESHVTANGQFGAELTHAASQYWNDDPQTICDNILNF